MTRNAAAVADLLAVARANPAEGLGPLLEHFRALLLAIAREESGGDGQPPWGDSALVQDTMLVACRNFPDFRGTTEAEFRAWLRVILRRLTLNQGRLFRAAKRRARAVAAGPPSDPTIELADSGQPTPSEDFARRERSEAVRAALARLPEDYREALTLRFRDRLPFEEVGRRLGRSSEAARKLIIRALKEMKRSLSGQFD